MYEIDEKQLRKWWEIFKGDGSLVEVRLLGTSTYSGYFNDIDTLITSLRPYLDHQNEKYYGALQAYFTLNDINDDLYGREQHDRFVKKPKATTTDSNVVRRRFIMIDLDACRVAGVSSSDGELEKSHLKAVDIYRYLIEQGFKEPIITTSGNGYHCYVPCDMPNDDTHNELVKRFLQSLGKMFSDSDVEIDEKVFNPARIDKLIGTWAKKGSDTEDRKWRLAKIVKVPQDLSPNDDSLFQKIADLLPKEEPKQAPNRSNRQYNNAPFDLRTWLNKYGIVYKEEVQGTGVKFILEHCPWEETHSSRQKWDSSLFQNADGKITFNCFHSHCKDKTWFDFRVFYEPDAYNRPQYQPQYQQRVYLPQVPQKPKYEIKDEIPELGEKWLSLSSIKKTNLSELEHVKTGFYELDKSIVGLYMSEVTILSGSNACVDCDTEYFNGTQWKRIADYAYGERVLQYNLDGSSELVIPKRYIKSPCEELYLLQSVTGVDQCVSENHNLVYMTSKGNLAKKSVEDMIEMHNKSKKGFTGKFYTTFDYKCGCGISLSNDEIRLMCAIISDGSFSCKFKDKNAVRFNLKKERKKKRLEMLLERCCIPYRKEQYNPNDKEYNTYIFHAPRKEKEFGDYWYSCSHEQFRVISDEILHWDGYINNTKHHTSSYCSTSKRNIDFIQFAFANVGVRTSIHIDNRVGKVHSNGVYKYKTICYTLTICKTKNPSVVNPKQKKVFEKVKTKDGHKYCFTVPSGMLILRRNGNINVTGNSGKSSWLNTLLLNIVNQDQKVALWSGELRADILKTWIQMVAAGKDHLTLSKFGDGKYYVTNNIGERIDHWLDGKLFVYNNEYGAKWQQIFHDMELLLNAGVKIFALDNLFSLDIDILDGDKNSKQRELILQIKEFAKKNKIHIILVAHPRKVTTFLRKNDISGSSDLQNAVDKIFIIHRVNNDFFKSGSDFFGKQKILQYQNFGNVIEVCKDRMFGVVDLLVGMQYEIESRRFLNRIDEDKHYGWENVSSHNEIIKNDNGDLQKQLYNDLNLEDVREEDKNDIPPF